MAYLIVKCRNCHKEMKEESWYLNSETNIKEYPKIKDRANAILNSYPIFHECGSDKILGMCDIIRIEV